jgi:hypothetical protein
MRIIYNKFIPFGNFGAMNILGLVFSRKPTSEVTLKTKRHEQTHTYQQYEILAVSALISLVLCNLYTNWWYLLGCLVIPFIIYLFGFFIELILPPYHNLSLSFGFVKGEGIAVKFMKLWGIISQAWIDAYCDNCFEREAYLNDNNPDYLATRKAFAWVGYILKRDERRGK